VVKLILILILVIAVLVLIGFVMGYNKIRTADVRHTSAASWTTSRTRALH
jgi:LemA protein